MAPDFRPCRYGYLQAYYHLSPIGHAKARRPPHSSIFNGHSSLIFMICELVRNYGVTLRYDDGKGNNWVYGVVAKREAAA